MRADITFCTFYFDISRGDWSTFTVSNDMYLYWFRNLLSLDIKLHITTEEKFAQEIKRARLKIDPNLNKTIIEITTIEQLEAYKKFNMNLERLMFSERFKKIVLHPSSPEMSKPLYNVLMFQKINYLERVSKKNPFKTDYFSWVDAGFIRGQKDVKGIVSWPDPDKLKLIPEKAKFFCINEDIENYIGSTKNHLLSQERLLKGTVFFIHKNLVGTIRDKFNRYVDQSIENGYIGSDEKIFDLCCLNDPELFDLYRCDWREELRLFAYDRATKPGGSLVYKVLCEWEEDDIEKCKDYDFWLFRIEDAQGNPVIKDSFSHVQHGDFLNFNKTNERVDLLSTRVPENFIIWPHSKSEGYLKLLKKKVKLLDDKPAAESDADNIDEDIDEDIDDDIDDGIGNVIGEYFCVNLDRAKHRLDFIKSEIIKSEILKRKIKRWVGFDGRNINPDWMPSKMITKKAYRDITSGLPAQRGLSLTPGGLGFYLTHIKIFEYAVSKNKNIFVMDDDVLVHENFDVEMREILKELPDTFDFCYLGYYDTDYEKIPFSKKLFIPRGQFNGPHSYIVSPKGAKKLLSFILPMNMQLDTKLYTLQNYIEYYAAYERLGMYVDRFESDIQHETGCVKYYEKTNLIRRIIL